MRNVFEEVVAAVQIRTVRPQSSVGGASNLSTSSGQVDGDGLSFGRLTRPALYAEFRTLYPAQGRTACIARCARICQIQAFT